MKWRNSLKDKLPKLSQEEIDNLSNAVSVKEIEIDFEGLISKIHTELI